MKKIKKLVFFAEDFYGLYPMGMKINYITWGILFCFVRLHGEIDDALIQARIESGRNIVDLSSETDEVHVYCRGTVYVFRVRTKEGCVTEYGIGAYGEKEEVRQFYVPVNWVDNVVRGMRREEIAYDVFVDGKPVHPRMDTIGNGDDWDIPQEELPRGLSPRQIGQCSNYSDEVLYYLQSSLGALIWAQRLWVPPLEYLKDKVFGH
jgi:hypothetical protein